jgi:pyruvate formate lyase activating enzyme
MTTGGKTSTVGYDITVAEIMKTVERDRPYYRRSGGGLTLSGGEALAQPNFARDLLKVAQENGIHTAMESTAMAEYGEIEKLLPYLDEFLLDIKHTNQTKHAEFTGKKNETPLQNAKKIAKSGMTKLIIRVPVIPGFNATQNEITNIARFAAALPGVEEIHLLPYHRFGEGKYSALGRPYPMGDVNPPDEGEMKILQNAVTNSTKLQCKIGG